jgi:hypothetical protein
LKQTTSRLRAEIEGEKAQREKAEANALKLAGLLDVGSYNVLRQGPHWRSLTMRCATEPQEAKEANQTIDSERKRLRLELDGKSIGYFHVHLLRWKVLNPVSASILHR